MNKKDGVINLMKAKNITLSGILISLTLLILYSTSLIPISTLSILTLASCLIPIAIIRSSVKYGFLVYISSTLLGFFFIPTNLLIMYGLFFGVYGIVKYYIEKLNKLSIEIILKLIFFNIILSLAFVTFKTLIGGALSSLPIWLLFLLAQPIFLIFDYALTLIISFYLDRIHKHI